MLIHRAQPNGKLSKHHQFQAGCVHESGREDSMRIYRFVRNLTLHAWVSFRLFNTLFGWGSLRLCNKLFSLRVKEEARVCGCPYMHHKSHAPSVGLLSHTLLVWGSYHTHFLYGALITRNATRNATIHKQRQTS